MPFCAACAYGKATRRSWRSRSSNNRDEAGVKSTPGETVSVDQMISPTPGLVAQMIGMLTNTRYTCATIYVDQYSGYSFIWLQKSTNAEETLIGKKAFEAHARESGVRIKHYHADNGVFKARSWVAECKRTGQRMMYAGVGKVVSHSRQIPHKSSFTYVLAVTITKKFLSSSFDDANNYLLSSISIEGTIVRKYGDNKK